MFRLLTIGCSNFTPLERVLSRRQPGWECRSAPFGQVFPSLLATGGPLWEAAPDVTLVWARPEQVLPTFARLLAGEAAPTDALNEELHAYVEALRQAAPRSRLATFVTTFATTTDHCGLGALDWNHPGGVARTLARLNSELALAIDAIPNLYLLDAGRWLAEVGTAARDAKAWLIGKTPYRLSVFESAADDIVHAVAALRGQARKLLILDLDDTLWGGILGDEGWRNLRVGGVSPLGEAYLEFQQAVLALRRRGVVLALCSKNDEAAALEAIDQHPEMALRRSDFAAWRINWTDKASNVASLLEELNLTPAAAVFIDDSPAERARVREALPEVLVPEWPSDPAQAAVTLRRLRCFDVARLTEEDLGRTEAYVAERERRAVRASVASVEDWIARLELRVVSQRLTRDDLPRAAQLLNKTNQFNLITRRLSEEELMALAAPPVGDVYTYRVADRFGDYGLTGLASMRVVDKVADVFDFVLSCRVMGRGVEQRMLAHLERVAREAGCTRMRARFERTARNGPCAEFLPGAGFRPDELGNWVMSLVSGARVSCSVLQEAAT